jgi:hypothetical protein
VRSLERRLESLERLVEERVKARVREELETPSTVWKVT